MINRKQDVTAMLTSLISFIVLLSICYVAISSNDDIDTLNSAWVMLFLGSGILFFIQVFYIAEMAGNVIAGELSSGRMKVWISLPVTREQIFARMIVRLLKRTAVLSFSLYVMLAFVGNVIFHTSPQNLLVAAFGVIQLMLVLLAYIVASILLNKRSSSLAISIVIPMLMHIVQVLSHVSMMRSGEANSNLLNTILTVLLPINTAYNNIIYGIAPHVDKVDIYITSSSWQTNTMLAVWLLTFALIIYTKIKRYETVS